MIERRIPPAGDPFTTSAAAHPSAEDETPHDGCIVRGFVFIGHMVIGEDGGEVEVFEVVPCRRCDDEVVLESSSATTSSGARCAPPLRPSALLRACPPPATSFGNPHASQ